MINSLPTCPLINIINFQGKIDLLLKRTRTIGLPEDLDGLVEVWLKDRCFHVSIDGNNSLLYDLHVVLNSMPIFESN